MLGGIALAGSRIVTLGLASASTVIFARLLGPALFGIYASAAAVLAVILIVGNFGIDQLFLRCDIEFLELRSRSIQLALLTAAMAFAGVLLWPGLPSEARICAIFLGIAAASDDLKLPFLLEPQRRLDFGSRGKRELLIRGIVTVLSVAVVLAHPSPVAISEAVLVASMLGVLVCRPLPSIRLINKRGAISAFRRALPYSLAGAVYTAYFQIDAAILASFRPAVEVGFYGVAYSIVFALIVFPVAMNNDVMLSRFYGTDRRGAEARRILRRFGIGSVVGGLIAFAGIETAGPLVIRLLFGEQYTTSVDLLRILGLALLPHFINSWEGNSLVGTGKIRLVLTIQSALLLTNIVGNLILIPAYGAEGAAWMTVCTEGMGTALYTTSVIRIWLRHSGKERGPHQA